MKNKRNYIVLILLIVLVSSFRITNTILQSENDEIIGTWISELDTKSKWVFSTNNKCKRYYNNELLNIYSYTITNSSCNNETDLEFNYLKLVKESNNKEYCYAINGITSDSYGTYLSIEFYGNPKPLLFKKQ
jgi:hypothetical protein